MQVRPVRLERSRAIIGAQRPLHRHKPVEPPRSPSLALVMGALFAGQSRMWGHSSRCKREDDDFDAPRKNQGKESLQGTDNERFHEKNGVNCGMPSHRGVSGKN